MNKETILQFLESWENMELIINDISNNTSYFELLMDIALNDNRYITWRAAWLIDKIHEKHPYLILPYLGELISNLDKQELSGKKRHFLKIISMHEVKEEHYGFLIDYCLKAFTSGKEPIAIKVHAMQILYNISINEPDLRNEIAHVIEFEIENHPTPGIVSRGKKLLRKLGKN